jgi:hypothetical protein
VHRTGEGRESQREERERDEGGRKGGRGVCGREGAAREEGRGRHVGPKCEPESTHQSECKQGGGGGEGCLTLMSSVEG